MHKQTLEEFVDEHGQARAAELLGLTQGGISKALRVGREVYVYRTENGFQAKEVKPFPAPRRVA